VDG
jgi:hypothetical protein